MKLARGSIAVAIALSILLPRATAAAQDCPNDARAGASWTLFLVGDVTSTAVGPEGLVGRGGGVELEWRSGERWSAGAAYGFRSFEDGGAGQRVGELGGAARVPTFGRPCLRIGVLAALGSSLNPGERYASLVFPLSLGVDRTLPLGAWSLTPSLSGLALLSWTDARLFGSAFRETDVGVGGELGLTARSRRLVLRAAIRRALLSPDLGPHPLGGFGAQGAVGVTW